MTKQTKAGVGKAAAVKTPMTKDRASAIQSRTRGRGNDVLHDEAVGSGARCLAGAAPVGIATEGRRDRN